MNNKGFAITTIVYGIVILIVLLSFSIITIMKNNYLNQKDLIKETNEKLNQCLIKEEC